MIVSTPVLRTAVTPVLRATLALCASAAGAQTATSPADAPVVVITATRQAQPLADAMAHTTLISREDIERSQAVDLAALLARESGVEFASSGGRGTATSLFVRGAPARQVLVLIDGVPLSRQDATGQVGIEHLMLDQVERIEVVRGNLSALYGAGAVGGVIQVFTRAPADGAPRGSAQLQAGSLGFAQGAAHAGAAFGATRIDLGASVQRSRGNSALNPADQPAANPDRDGYRNTSLALNLAHTLAEGHRLGLGLTHTDGKLDYDSAFATPADTQRSRTRITTVQASSDNRIREGWTSRLVLSEQRDRSAYDESGAFGYSARYTTTARSLNWIHAITLAPRWKATAGLDLQRQRIDADDGFGGTYDKSRSLQAVHGAVEARLGAHQLQIQLRHDHVGGIGSQASGRLGWGWDATPEWRLLASLANAFSAPPLGYLYAPFFGNPALKPERAGSAELGAQWSSGSVLVRATAFENRVRDELDYDLATNQFQNIARTRNRGVELSASGRLGAHTDLRASLTSQDPEDRSTGQRRLRRAATLASATISHEFGAGWRAGLAWRHAGERPDTGGVTLPAYDVADLTAQWDVSPAWQLFGRIENVGDVRWQTAFGYDQPGRGLFLGLRWRGAL